MWQKKGGQRDTEVTTFFRATFQAAKIAPVKTSAPYGCICRRWQWGHGPLLHPSSRLEHVGASPEADAQVSLLAIRHMVEGCPGLGPRPNSSWASLKAIVYLHPQPQLNCNILVTLVACCISRLILPHSLEATSMERDPALNKQTCPCVVPLTCVLVSPRAHFLLGTLWQQW